MEEKEKYLKMLYRKLLFLRQELGMQESGDRGGLMSSADGIGALVITPFLLTEGVHEVRGACIRR